MPKWITWNSPSGLDRRKPYRSKTLRSERTPYSLRSGFKSYPGRVPIDTKVNEHRNLRTYRDPPVDWVKNASPYFKTLVRVAAPLAAASTGYISPILIDEYF